MEMLSKEEKFRLFYETGVQLHRREVELLFQRFNFFLIGTAFLITAFATVVVSQNLSVLPSHSLAILAHAIGAVSFYIAFFFTITNYANTRTIRALGDYIWGLEKGDSPEPPFLNLKNKVSQPIDTPCSLIKKMGAELWSIFLSPFDFSKARPAPHTWLIPLGFVLFWIVVWFWILPCRLVPLICVIGIPLLYLGLSQLANCLIQKCKMRKKG